MAFRFQGSKIFLTYTQVPGHLHELEHFQTAIAALDWWKPTNYVIGRERHEDEGIHYHVLYAQENKFSTRNNRYWDLAYEGGVVHPNVQTVATNKDVARIRTYCKKEGNVTEYPFKLVRCKLTVTYRRLCRVGTLDERVCLAGGS